MLRSLRHSRGVYTVRVLAQVGTLGSGGKASPLETRGRDPISPGDASTPRLSIPSPKEPPLGVGRCGLVNLAARLVLRGRAPAVGTPARTRARAQLKSRQFLGKSPGTPVAL
jgi:hypothetical protein